ncbi:MAG: nidogen-like domain-containing protein, partial [Candidatus Thermoplasmatota archaeon]
MIIILLLFPQVPMMKADGSAPTDIAFGRPATPFSVADGRNAVTPLGSAVSGANSDDSSEEVVISDSIEDGLKLGDTIYNSIYVGSNGYITFGHSQTSYSPEGIPGYTDGPMIAGQYDDINPSNGGTVYLYEDDSNDIVSVTWYNVEPYESPTDGSGSNTFQIRLHGLGGGDFGIEIRYEDISWTRGMPADPGSYPTGGWTVGDGETYGEVNDSGTSDFITIEDESNIGHPGVFAWNVNNGGVVNIDTQIKENSVGGTFVGNLTASDADNSVSNLDFLLLDDDGGNFEICTDSETGGRYVEVAPGAELDYETSTNHQRQITVQAEDPDGNTGSAVLNITLLDQQIEFTNETIYHQQTNVRPDTSGWSVDIKHPSGGTFNWWINTTPDIGSASGTSSNTHISPTCTFNDLQPYTTYTVHVAVRGSDQDKNYTFTTGDYVGKSSWHNQSYLNVTVEWKKP